MLVHIELFNDKFTLNPLHLIRTQALCWCGAACICLPFFSLPPVYLYHFFQQAPFAASSFSSVPYCAQPAKGVFNVPEDSSHPQGISLSVSNCFLSRHGSFPVPSVSVCSIACCLYEVWEEDCCMWLVLGLFSCVFPKNARPILCCVYCLT